MKSRAVFTVVDRPSGCREHQPRVRHVGGPVILPLASPSALLREILSALIVVAAIGVVLLLEFSS